MTSPRSVMVVVLGAMAVGCEGAGPTPAGDADPATDAGTSSTGGAGISATVNGESLAVPGRATVLTPGGTTVTNVLGSARVGDAQVLYQIQFPGAAPGSFACASDAQVPRIQFQRLDSSRNLTSDTILGGACRIDVAEVGPVVGGMVRGTFSARTENASGVVDIVGGTFAVPHG